MAKKTDVTSQEDSMRERVWLVLGGLLMALAILISVAWRPDFYFPTDIESLNALRIDISMTFLLPYLFEHGTQFGKDVIFPYGPFGFIMFLKYHPAVFPWMILGQMFLAVVFVRGCWDLVPRCWNVPSAVVMALFLALIIALFQYDVLMQSYVILLLFTYFFTDSKPLSASLVLLAVAAALVALMKVSLFFLTSFVVLSITIADLFIKRRPPWTLTIFSIVFIVLWVVSGQHLANIPAYVQSLLQFVSGYTDAMSFGTLEGENLLDIVLYCAVSVLMLLLLIALFKPYKNLFYLFPSGLTALVLFMVFKHAFVRHDAHAIEAGYMPLFFLFLFAAVWPRFRVAGPVRGLFFVYCIASLLAGYFIVSHWLGHGPAGAFMLEHVKKKADILSQASGMLDVALHGRSSLNEMYREETAAIRKASGIEPFRETVDLYPDNLAILAALQLPYDPRPIVMSHGAYTPFMARLNAGHLKGGSAPERIFFKVETIDNHYPSLDDGLSWLELWTRYDLAGSAGEYLLLRRLESVRPYTLTKVVEMDTRFGQTFDLTSLKDSLVWAEIDVQPSLLGRLLRIGYKLPELYMAVRSGDGAVRGYRVIPGMLSAGFLLAPTVQTAKEFADIMRHRRNGLPPSAQVTAFMFGVAHWGKSESPAGKFYDNHVKIRLYRLDL